MKTWFFRLLLLVWCAVLGAAEAVLPEGTPVFSKPEHTSKLLLLTMEPMAVELGDSQRVLVKKHPLARYYTFTEVHLPDGRCGYMDPDVYVRLDNGIPKLIFPPRRPLWRALWLAAALGGMVYLGWDFRKKRPVGRALYWRMGLFLIFFRQALLLWVLQGGENLVASPMDEAGYWFNLQQFCKGDFSQPWHFTVGLSLLYAPFAAAGISSVDQLVLPFSIFSGLILSPLMIAAAFGIALALLRKPWAAWCVGLLWSVLPFVLHHHAGFDRKWFYSYWDLPSMEFTFAHYVTLIGAGFNAMSDTPSTLLVLGTALWLWIGRKSDWKWQCLPAACFFGFACMVRINNILYAPLLAGIFWWSRPGWWMDRKKLLQLLSGTFVMFCIGFLPQFVVNYHFFGNALRFSYTNYEGGAHTYLSKIFFELNFAYYTAANFPVWAAGGAAMLFLKETRLRLLLWLWGVPAVIFFSLYSHGTDDAVRFVMPTYPAFLIALAAVGCGIGDRKLTGIFAGGMVLLLLVAPNGCYGEFARYLPWPWSRPEGMAWWSIFALTGAGCCAAYLWRKGEWRSGATLALSGLLLAVGCGYMIAILWAASGIAGAVGAGKSLYAAWQQNRERVEREG